MSGEILNSHIESGYRKEEFPVLYGLEAIYSPFNANISELLVQKLSNGTLKRIVLSGPPQIGKSRIAYELREEILHNSSLLKPYANPLDLVVTWYDNARQSTLEDEKWKNYAKVEYEQGDPNWFSVAYRRIAEAGLEDEFRTDINNRIVENYTETSQRERVLLSHYIQGLEIPLAGKNNFGRSALNKLTQFPKRFYRYFVLAIIPDESETHQSEIQSRGNFLSELVLSTPAAYVKDVLEQQNILIKYSDKNLSSEEVGKRVQKIYRWLAPRERTIKINEEIKSEALKIPPKRLDNLRASLAPKDQNNLYALHMLDVLSRTKYDGGVRIPKENFAIVVSKFKNVTTTIDLDFLENKNI